MLQASPVPTLDVETGIASGLIHDWQVPIAQRVKAVEILVG